MKEQTNGLPQALSLLSAGRGIIWALIALFVLELLTAAPAKQALAAGNEMKTGQIMEQLKFGTGFAKKTTTEKMLIPVGRAVGIKLFADGVMVVGISDVAGPKGACSPAKTCGLQEGDIITYINQEKIQSTEDLKAVLQNVGGQQMTIRLLRGGRLMQLDAKTVQTSDDGSYKLGAWTRDSMAGIGTLTFYDPESGVFGALGHGINDVDTALLVPLASGSIMQSTVTDVIRGQCGNPGELRGKFDLTADLGELFANTAASLGQWQINLLSKIKRPCRRRAAVRQRWEKPPS